MTLVTDVTPILITLYAHLARYGNTESRVTCVIPSLSDNAPVTGAVARSGRRFVRRNRPRAHSSHNPLYVKP